MSAKKLLTSYFTLLKHIVIKKVHESDSKDVIIFHKGILKYFMFTRISLFCSEIDCVNWISPLLVNFPFPCKYFQTKILSSFFIGSRLPGEFRSACTSPK